MSSDRRLVEEEGADFPILRFFSWPLNGAITLGRFLDQKALVHDSSSIEVSVRPTGGGLLLHQPSDLSFSLFLPNGHRAISQVPKQNYNHIHNWIYRAISHVSSGVLVPQYIHEETTLDFRPMYCMASYTPYDIVMKNKKIGGSACRSTKLGLLFQATLFLEPIDHIHFLSALKNGQEAIYKMQQVSISVEELLCEKNASFRKRLIEALCDSCESAF